MSTVNRERLSKVMKIANALMRTKLFSRSNALRAGWRIYRQEAFAFQFAQVA